MSKPPLISVVIPAHNEGKVIYQTVRRLLPPLALFVNSYEVIVVADGCSDNTVAQAEKIKDPHFRVLSYKKNHGKGYAIQYGIKHASGEFITFYDAGGDFDADHIDRFVKLAQVFDADIVIGSKRHPASVVNYPMRRKILSFIYHKLVNLLFGIRVSDTQTGLKVIRRDVALKIFPRLLVKQYAFDLEMLVVARILGFKRIFEAPVHLKFNSVSSGINWQSIQKMLIDTLAIFYRARVLRYYHRPHEYHLKKSMIFHGDHKIRESIGEAIEHKP